MEKLIASVAAGDGALRGARGPTSPEWGPGRLLCVVDGWASDESQATGSGTGVAMEIGDRRWMDAPSEDDELCDDMTGTRGIDGVLESAAFEGVTYAYIGRIRCLRATLYCVLLGLVNEQRCLKRLLVYDFFQAGNGYFGDSGVLGFITVCGQLTDRLYDSDVAVASFLQRNKTTKLGNCLFYLETRLLTGSF